MTSISAEPHLISLAPQFLVDDLSRSIAFYRDVLGFTFGEPWGGFYAIGRRDGLELHLKEASKNTSEARIAAPTSISTPMRESPESAASTRTALPMARPS
jgi:catechol 2,3-dioxygenase-like lactoylglutathione lyase family enzyme